MAAAQEKAMDVGSDSEYLAIDAVMGAIGELSNPARRRVVEFALARLEEKETASAAHS